MLTDVRIPAAFRPYTRWLTQLRYNRVQRRQQGQPIVMFTMGKTGSTTLMATLRRHIPERPVYQVHMFSRAALARVQREYQSTAPNRRSGPILAARYLRTQMPTANRPWDVICTVRDPGARVVSAFFQTGERLGHALDDPTLGRQQLLEWHGLRRCASWFETELGPALGIDVFEHPFDPAVGYQIIETPNVRLLLLRLESFSAASKALEEFLGLPIPELATANITEDKRHAASYRRFVDAVTLPADVLDRLYGTRYAQHFYLPEERARFRAAWATSEPSQA